MDPYHYGTLSGVCRRGEDIEEEAVLIYGAHFLSLRVVIERIVHDLHGLILQSGGIIRAGPSPGRFRRQQPSLSGRRFAEADAQKSEGPPMADSRDSP